MDLIIMKTYALELFYAICIIAEISIILGLSLNLVKVIYKAIKSKDDENV